MRSLITIGIVVWFGAICLAGPLKESSRPKLDGRIVGGNDTKIEAHPYQLSLKLSGSHFCGASIIGEYWAITAAHCAKGINAESMTVSAGSANKYNGTVFNISKVIIHPDYNPYKIDYDIALLKVSKKFPKTSQIQKIALTNSVPADNTTVIVSGWGTTTSGGTSPTILREAYIKMVNHDKCNSIYGDITERMICAAAPGRDSCQGDSGGPLTTEVPRTLVGLVSWGLGCAEPGYPGVYTNVANLRQWIRDQS